ncbi:DinB family protein [Flexithrix dorotheae]|uniref:DinB family protein n=1 Tax=Flexithrix dorotheae TaxID=70993 RepID=UPI0003708ACB|nr:DinB family protein [Flexithrix dorotheae]
MENWSKQIDRITQKFSETFGKLSIEELNWKPGPEKWSIAQNIDHLILINQTYFPIIDSIGKGTYKTPFLAKFGFIISFFGQTVLKAVQPDRRKKMKTFPIWEPSKSEIPSGILDRFKTHQSELKKIMENSKDLVEKGVVISSPANKNIVYKLGKAFEIIVTHEQRHFEQSREIYKVMKKENQREY